MMEELETYDYRGDPEYIDSFALDSNAIQRYIRDHDHARSGLSPRASARFFGERPVDKFGRTIRKKARGVMKATTERMAKLPEHMAKLKAAASPKGWGNKKAEVLLETTPATAPEAEDWDRISPPSDSGSRRGSKQVRGPSLLQGIGEDAPFPTAPGFPRRATLIAVECRRAPSSPACHRTSPCSSRPARRARRVGTSRQAWIRTTPCAG
jgi:hypothetical protein